jgi:hypothetical protein
MFNPYVAFKKLLPNPSVYAGTVQSVAGGVALIELPDGAIITGRGSATPGQVVFVRDGAIEGVAPALTVELIDL